MDERARRSYEHASSHEGRANEELDRAAYKLGVIYEQGVYVPTDDATALAYYKIALANGDTDAPAAIDRLTP